MKAEEILKQTRSELSPNTDYGWGTDVVIEAMERYAKLYHESEVKKLSLADVISSESNITVCDNCGNDNVDDGKHKYNMERCRCCEHYL